MHTTHFLNNASIQTAYHDLGEGKPLVLIHGFTGSKLDFTDQLECFSDLSRVIAFDQRGHGESSNQGPYEEAQFVDDLINFLDRLEIPSCDLLGHSFGGMVAMRAVLDHPERFSSLILMDTCANPMELIPAKAREGLNNLVAEKGCEVLIESMRGGQTSPAAQRGIDFLGASEHWRRIAVKLSQMDPDAFRDIGDYFGARPDLLQTLKALSCPTTIIVGAADKPFMEASREMAAAIPHSVLQIIEDAGHSPQYENAPAWREAVVKHLLRSLKKRGSE